MFELVIVTFYNLLYFKSEMESWCIVFKPKILIFTVCNLKMFEIIYIWNDGKSETENFQSYKISSCM